MEHLKIYFLKALKKLKWAQYFDFSLQKTLHNTIMKIPYKGGIGLTNMLLKKEWLDSLIESFVTDKNDVFVDVGVNIGQTLLRLKTLLPEAKYLGFEPNADCVSYVQKLVKMNKFGNCSVQNAALSTEVDILYLNKTSDTDSRASMIDNLRPDYFQERVPVLALDYQSFYLDEPISFVKIDVEGAELEVLQGMEKAVIKHQPIITCEVLDSHNNEVFEFTQTRATKLCELLKSWNYKIIRLTTDSGSSSKITDFKKMDTIQIVQWTSASYALNDYLFYPMEKEKFIVEKLQSIMSKN